MRERFTFRAWNYDSLINVILLSILICDGNWACKHTAKSAKCNDSRAHATTTCSHVSPYIKATNQNRLEMGAEFLTNFPSVFSLRTLNQGQWCYCAHNRSPYVICGNLL